MKVMGAQQLSDYQYCSNILFCIQQQKESYTVYEQQQKFSFCALSALSFSSRSISYDLCSVVA